MTDELQTRLVKLGDQYPKCFSALVTWLEAPGLHGKFEIHRGGEVEIKYTISRHHRDGLLPRAGDRGPARR